MTLVPAATIPSMAASSPSIHACTSPAEDGDGKVYAEKTRSRDAPSRDLAVHLRPHALATKLARHFIADTPLLRWYEKMAKVFLETAATSRNRQDDAVSPESWTPPPSNSSAKRGVVGMVRATGITQVDPVRFHGAGRDFSAKPLAPSSPRAMPTMKRPGSTMGRRLDVATISLSEAGKGEPQDVIGVRLVGSCAVSRGEAGRGSAESRQQALASCSCRLNSRGGDHEFSPSLPSRARGADRAGALFAWTQMPGSRATEAAIRAARHRCCGRARRTGAVEPVGDPDWIGLRGDRALVLDARRPRCRSMRFFALNRDAEPAPVYKRQQASSSRHRHALSRRSHFDGQDVLKVASRGPGHRYRLAQSRARRAGVGRGWICAVAAPSASARSRPCGAGKPP